MKNNSLWSTVLTALLSAVTGLGRTLVNPLLDRFKLVPLLCTVFAAVDPVIKHNLPDMTSHDIYQAFRFAALAAADGNLSELEINRLTELAMKRCNLQILANAGVVPQMDTPKLQAAIVVAAEDFKAKQVAALSIKPPSGAAALGTVAVAGAHLAKS